MLLKFIKTKYNMFITYTYICMKRMYSNHQQSLLQFVNVSLWTQVVFGLNNGPTGVASPTRVTGVTTPAESTGFTTPAKPTGVTSGWVR